MANRYDDRDRRRDYEEWRDDRPRRFENREDWRYFGERDRERHYGREEDRPDWGQDLRQDWMSYGRPYESGEGNWRTERGDEQGWNYGRERGYSRGEGWGSYAPDWDRDRHTRSRGQVGWTDYEADSDFDRDWERQRQFRDRQRRGWTGYGRDYNQGFQNRPQDREMRRRYGRDQYGSQYGYGGYDRGETGFRSQQRGFGSQDYGRGFGETRRWEEDYDDSDIINPYEDEDTDWVYTEVWTIEGPFSGIGPMGYERSDERIFEEVCERLTQHGQIDARNIEVEVQGGEVTLKGSVNDRHTKRMAEDVVATVPGVWDVHNNLRMSEEQRSRGQWGIKGQQAGTSMTDRKNQIHKGMRVLGSDNKDIGEVKEIRGNDFLVDRGMQRDVYVPFSATTRVAENHITLTVPADQVNNQNWPNPELLESSERKNQ